MGRDPDSMVRWVDGYQQARPRGRRDAAATMYGHSSRRLTASSGAATIYSFQADAGSGAGNGGAWCNDNTRAMVALAWHRCYHHTCEAGVHRYPLV